MSPNMLPFNLDLLVLTKADLDKLGEVRVQDIHEGMTKNFHPLGLFSTEIFGKVGDTNRTGKFAYITLNTEIFHPIVYKAICDLKELYGEILASRAYATWDDGVKDFIKSDVVNGQTGFQFFMKHWSELRPEHRVSARREEYLQLLEKYRGKTLISHLVVLPAGMRDYELDLNGRPSENEINPFYRRVLAMAGVMSNSKIAGGQQEAIDRGRFSIQQTVWEIYEYYRNILDGKTGAMQAKFASRKVSDTTRSVITAQRIEASSLNDPRLVGPNDTVMGLHQFIRNIAPLAIYSIKDRVLSKALPGPNAPALLVNPKTLKREMVTIPHRDYDKWMTYDGLEAVFVRFAEDSLRHEAVTIKGHYLSLTYVGPDNTVRLFSDIDELPDDRDRKHVHPTTIAELLYYGALPHIGKIPNFNTRYPVAGFGSVYPAWCMVRTTLPSLQLSVLNEQWGTSGEQAIDWPIIGGNFFNAMSVAAVHLGRLAGDHDGDMLNSVGLMSEDSIQEVQEQLDSRSYYIGPNGKLNFGTGNDVLNILVKYLTAPAQAE